MDIGEQGEEHVIGEYFHGELDENLFQDLVADDIWDPNLLNIDNPNMEGGRQGPGQQGPQIMVIVDPMRNLPKNSGEKTESADNHLDAFDDYLEIQQINAVDVKVAQIITRYGMLYLVKPKRGLTRVEKIDHMPLLQTGMLWKNSPSNSLT